MNGALIKVKKNINSQKSKYLFLSIITLVGIISGILFILFISKEDKLLVKNELELFLSNIKDNKLDYLLSLFTSILSNILYFVVIWVLGISIIGIPIIIFLLFLKGFVFGFSFSSIINIYNIKGIFISISSQIPHNLILMVLYILISFYAINFSIKLFKMLFLKENINLSLYLKRYNKILVICILISIICSILETFLAPILINLFL